MSLKCWTSDEEKRLLKKRIDVAAGRIPADMVIQNAKIVQKKELKLPKSVTNVILCRNPRCITSVEQGLDHVFILTDPEKEVYRCRYCEEQYHPNK